MSKVTCMVLAAGKGTRMRSDLPKVLHEVMGRPILVRLMESLLDGPPMGLVVVVGHDADLVKRTVESAFPGKRVAFAVQQKQLGTGHAVAAGLTAVPRGSSAVVVVNGDLPLVRSGTVHRVAETHAKAGAALTVATMFPPDPSGYGRILRTSSGRIMGIREDRDCSPAEREIREVNAGLYCFARSFLEASITRLGKHNDQKEFYLTDLVETSGAAAGLPVADVDVPWDELRGVNSRRELADVEEVVLDRVRDSHMAAGVSMGMPSTIWIDEKIRIGADTRIGPRASLRGGTAIGAGCRIGEGCVISDSRIEDGARIEPYSVLDGATVRARAIVGPFARLRPGSDVGPDAHVGNFVELKNTTMGPGAKANHLSYLGDGAIGGGSNIGAGTIFCNYDGVRKHRTVIEENVFIGSDSQLVAPVRIGKGSYVGSGSTITRDVPPGSLALARARQVTKEGRAIVLRQMLERGGLPGAGSRAAQAPSGKPMQPPPAKAVSAPAGQQAKEIDAGAGADPAAPAKKRRRSRRRGRRRPAGPAATKNGGGEA